jgi:RNA polymerase sigma factor (sigma-70 family)
MSPSAPPVLQEVLHASDPQGCDEAWATFVAHHSRLLLKVASAKWGGYDATMDRYAYILDKLREQDFRRLRGYQPGDAKFSTWLVVVARRLCSDFDRERYGRPREPGTAESVARRSLAELAGAVQVNEELVQAPDDVAATLDVAERDRLLAEAVAGLPADDRLLVRLRYDDGISVQEIRAAVGLPTVFHVYRRLKAIHTQLRETLERGGLTRAAE